MEREARRNPMPTSPGHTGPPRRPAELRTLFAGWPSAPGSMRTYNLRRPIHRAAFFRPRRPCLSSATEA